MIRGETGGVFQLARGDAKRGETAATSARLEVKGMGGQDNHAVVSGQRNHGEHIVAAGLTDEVDHLADAFSLLVLDGHADHLAAAKHHARGRGIAADGWHFRPSGGRGACFRGRARPRGSN
jgi:hypothetical protein